MQFRGWWVSGDSSGVSITPHTFDEVELSEDSNWREAVQNQDPSSHHGYIDWDSAIDDAKRRLGIEEG